MGQVLVHPRVTARHPELTDDDVRHAWRYRVDEVSRLGDEDRFVAIGFDRRGRMMEMIAVRTIDDDWVIYHAYAPATHKVLRELGLEG